jgi:DNA uptake protein ComE-like DNA-binding protein
VTFLLKGKINMADMTSLTTDPFFALTGQVNGVREKVSDSIFENYKLQVAQTNDINNRAMQVALHDASELAAIKQEIANSTLQAMLAAARTDAQIGATSAAQQRLVMEQAEATRRLIVDLNTQNLNTALINTNTALNGLNGQYAGLGLAYGGAVAAYQSANTNSALSALNSAIASQSSNVIGAGAVGGTQTATPTTVV